MFFLLPATYDLEVDGDQTWVNYSTVAGDDWRCISQQKE